MELVDILTLIHVPWVVNCAHGPQNPQLFSVASGRINGSTGANDAIRSLRTNGARGTVVKKLIYPSCFNILNIDICLICTFTTACICKIQKS